MKTVEIKLYQFAELSEDAQLKAIHDHIKFWITSLAFEQLSNNAKRAIQKAENLQTPWFTGQYLYEYCKDEIISEIKECLWDFTEQGELY